MDTKTLRDVELPPPPFLSVDARAPSLPIPSKNPFKTGSLTQGAPEIRRSLDILDGVQYVDIASSLCV